MTTIQEAKNLRNKIDVKGIIKKIDEPRNINLKTGGTTRVANAELEDSTGTMTLQLWGDNIPKVKIGSEVEVKNGYTSTFKGETSLGVGKFGTFSVTKY